MKTLAWGYTDTGQKRQHNEDAFLICPELSLFAVADGMGGHQGGDCASRLAVQILEREIRGAVMDGTQPIGPEIPAPPARELQSAAQTASRTIYGLAQNDGRLAGMGTTLTTLLFHGERAYLAHVGDSRAYLFRDEKLEQLTEDHSWIEEQVRSGFMTSDEAKDSSLKHIITRSVGFEPEVEVDQLCIPYLMGDCFLLCSDGLSNHVDTLQLSSCLSSGYYGEIPKKLVELANTLGGEDNITVVVIYVANDARKRDLSTLQETSDGADEFDPYAVTLVPDMGAVDPHEVTVDPDEDEADPDEDTIDVPKE